MKTNDPGATILSDDGVLPGPGASKGEAGPATLYGAKPEGGAPSDASARAILDAATFLKTDGVPLPPARKPDPAALLRPPTAPRASTVAGNGHAHAKPAPVPESSGAFDIDLDAATILKADTPLPVAPRASNTGPGLHPTPTPIPQGTVLPTPTPSGKHTQGGEPAKPRALRPGEHVNHYELIRELGKGGMGSVFLARDNKLGRRVAIKFLHTQRKELTKRFILEARTTARFSHENIVTIYEVDEHAGQPYMVLEFLQGQPLTKLVGEGKPMPVARAVELIVPIVRALAAAHAQDIVHRDLKFDNVLVTDSGTIKVLDFGIAKVLQGDDRMDTEASLPVAKEAPTGEENTALTRHGTIMGTPAFMAPEQWNNGVGIDNRSDIWAVGIMLYRMLAGRHPLHPLTGFALSVTGRLKEPMPLLREAAPDCPAELAAVVDRCLLKKKEDRWPDALSLLRALEPFLPGRYTRELKIDESPYAGLSSFQESDADRFFGRATEVAAMVNRIRDQALMAVVGPSGTGKSSFVRAGLVPALKRSGETWETLVIRPGRNPLQALASIVAPMVSTSASVIDDLEEQKKLVERLGREPGYIGSVLRSRARHQKSNILVFVDQFEELYTLVGDPNERLTFTHCLASVADDATSPTRVVLSIRSDFLDRVPEDQSFMAELTKGLFFLTPPVRDGLRDALVQPAEMAGYRFETPELVDDMLSHLQSTQGALPLLQFAAAKLWESRDPARRMLTRASYDAIGGIAGALASHADSVLRELSPQARTLTRSIFLRLVTSERTRAIVSIDELRELSGDTNEVQRLVDQLVQARLLVVQTGSGGSGATVEIVHESLIHSWPTLRRWLDETGEDAAFLEQLRAAAKQWQAKGHDAGLLWRGEVVDEAHRFQRRFRGELPKLQRAFLEAVFAQEARAARLKRAMTVGGLAVLGLLFLAAVAALVVIRNAQREAERQALVARAAEALSRQAETEAKQRLLEVQAKERERAEATKKAEEARAAAEAAAQAEQQKSQELAAALHDAEQAKNLAAAQKYRAEEKAREAAEAQRVAQQKAAEAKKLADAEAQRAHALEKQLGSPVIETLK